MNFVRNLTIRIIITGRGGAMQTDLERTHELLYELLPLYFEKMGMMFKKADKLDLHCNKNQNRAIHMIKREGKITASQLGRKLDMEKGSLTTLIDSLEEMQYVTREPHATDRRKVLLALTQQGEHYFDKMITSHYKYLAEILQGQTDEEIGKFNANLQEVLGFLRRL